MYIAVITFSLTESDLIFVANMSESWRLFLFMLFTFVTLRIIKEIVIQSSFFLYEKQVLLFRAKSEHTKKLFKTLPNIADVRTKNTHTLLSNFIFYF